MVEGGEQEAELRRVWEKYRTIPEMHMLGELQAFGGGVGWKKKKIRRKRRGRAGGGGVDGGDEDDEDDEGDEGDEDEDGDVTSGEAGVEAGDAPVAESQEAADGAGSDATAGPPAAAASASAAAAAVTAAATVDFQLAELMAPMLQLSVDTQLHSMLSRNTRRRRAGGATSARAFKDLVLSSRR
jgi:hypothetical protein